MEIFCILFGVGILVMQVHMFVKNHLTVHLRYVHFTLCHLIKKKKTWKTDVIWSRGSIGGQLTSEGDEKRVGQRIEPRGTPRLRGAEEQEDSGRGPRRSSPVASCVLWCQGFLQIPYSQGQWNNYSETQSGSCFNRVLCPHQIPLVCRFPRKRRIRELRTVNLLGCCLSERLPVRVTWGPGARPHFAGVTWGGRCPGSEKQL